MSRSIRVVLLVGCSGLGLLRLPEAASALSNGLSSPLREARAMERSARSDQWLDDHEDGEDKQTLAKRD